MADFQNFFEYTTFADNPPSKIYNKKIEKRVLFKIKSEFILKPSPPEKIMTLLGSIEIR